MSRADQAFANLMRLALYGQPTQTRNGPVFRISGQGVVYTEETPLISLRKVAWKLALREWEWFMSGSENINDLHPSVHHWWKPWANKDGIIANNYSKQFRRSAGKYGEIDQIEAAINLLKKDPNSRRNVLTTWNPNEMSNPDTPITNCHGTMIQLFGYDGKLQMITYQRSCDLMLGVPHNWIQYWAFLLWLSAESGLQPHMLSWMGGDIHIYEQHAKVASDILNGDKPTTKSPQLIYTGRPGEPFKADNFVLDSEYKPMETARLDMIV